MVLYTRQLYEYKIFILIRGYLDYRNTHFTCERLLSRGPAKCQYLFRFHSTN